MSANFKYLIPYITIKPIIEDENKDKQKSGLKIRKYRNMIEIMIDNNSIIWDLFTHFKYTKKDIIINYVYSVLGDRLNDTMSMETNFGINPIFVNKTNFKEKFTECLTYLIDIESLLEYKEEYRKEKGWFEQIIHDINDWHYKILPKNTSLDNTKEEKVE